MPEQRVTRVIATVAAVVVVVDRGGVGQGPVLRGRHLHIFSPLLGDGGDDGAIDILLVGMDSRTDAHGNPLTPTNWRGCTQATTSRPTPTPSSWCASRTTGSPRPRSRSPATPMCPAPGLGKTKINGVYGPTKEEKRVRLVESGVAADRGRARGHRGRPRGADQDGRRPDRRHRRPLRRDRAAGFRVDHRCPRRGQCVPERRRSTNPFRVPTSPPAGRS